LFDLADGPDRRCGSAGESQARGDTLAGDQENRKHPRKEVNWPITIVAEHGTINGEIRNISAEGLFVLCEEPLRLNETYRMSVSPGKHQAIGVLGKVVWADAYCMAEDDSAFGIGLCLVEISNQDRASLRQILTDL
jgi:PilZ domain